MKRTVMVVADPAYDAETVDEYRELAMLANAWERGSLEADLREGAGFGVVYGAATDSGPCSINRSIRP